MRILSKYVIAGMELASELKEVNLDSGIIINEDIIKTIKNNNIDYLDIKTNSEFDTINDSIKRLIEIIRLLNGGMTAPPSLSKKCVHTSPTTFSAHFVCSTTFRSYRETICFHWLWAVPMPTTATEQSFMTLYAST